MESMEYIQFDEAQQAEMATAIGAAAHSAEQFGEALEWFEKAAKAGHSEAMCNLAYMYHHGQGTDKDELKAAVWLQRAAELGNPRAAQLRREFQAEK